VAIWPAPWTSREPDDLDAFGEQVVKTSAAAS
jgi:hypothetical protein